jgi:hypothetical protein
MIGFWGWMSGRLTAQQGWRAAIGWRENQTPRSVTCTNPHRATTHPRPSIFQFLAGSKDTPSSYKMPTTPGLKLTNLK